MLQIFEREGLLSRQIPGYEERIGQIHMANDVWTFLSDKYPAINVLMAEGPVGVGKTMGYLLPTILNENGVREGIFPIIVSVSAITLQNQLVTKDLPDVAEIVEKALGYPISYCALKGINNYLCLEKLDTSQVPEDFKNDFSQLYKLTFSNDYDGERPDELPWEVWEEVTTTSHECMKKGCKYARDCYYMKKKRRAEAVQILVVNHSLLAADIYIRQLGNPGILPTPGCLIIDEAHEFEAACTNFFTFSLSRRVIDNVMNKMHKTIERISDMDIPEHQKSHISNQVKELLSSLQVINLSNIADSIEDIGKKYYNNLVEGEYPDFNKFAEEFDHLADRAWSITYFKDDGFLEEPEEVSVPALLSYGGFLRDIARRFKTLAQNDLNTATWSEGSNYEHPTIKMAPISMGEFLKPFWNNEFHSQKVKFILTSATMSVNGKFDFLMKRLGVDSQKAVGAIYESPFDHYNQATLFVPKSFDPKSPTFNADVLHGIKTAVIKGYAKTLVLFTSYKQMNELIPEIKMEFNGSHLVLEQSKNLSKAYILEKFREADKAILVAQAASFGTGVDIKGDKNVILVKLDFDVPSDPLFKARCAAIEAAGGNPFIELSVPSVIIKTKQQVGRAIRTSQDRAFILILDGRVARPGFGQKVLNSLPKMKYYTKL